MMPLCSLRPSTMTTKTTDTTLINLLRKRSHFDSELLSATNGFRLNIGNPTWKLTAEKLHSTTASQMMVSLNRALLMETYRLAIYNDCSSSKCVKYTTGVLSTYRWKIIDVYQNYYLKKADVNVFIWVCFCFLWYLFQ